MKSVYFSVENWFLSVENIVSFISSANIATGFHAGDPNWMKKTVDLAIANNVEIGAHPSFHDLVGFIYARLQRLGVCFRRVHQNI